jgi:putative endonuclease
VYIPLLNNGQYYVGSTDNIERRFAQHSSGKVIATKGKLPAELLHTREYPTLTDARKMEYYSKRMKSRKYIEEFMISS